MRQRKNGDNMDADKWSNREFVLKNTLKNEHTEPQDCQRQII